MDEVVAKASDTVIRGFDNQPAIDVASLTDYDQMKDISAEILRGEKARKVRNIKAYLMAALFNAGSTMGSYYKAEVNHDMPQFAGRQSASKIKRNSIDAINNTFYNLFYRY